MDRAIPAPDLPGNDGAALLRSWPAPRQAAHKGQRGDVRAWGGAAGMVGALLLCARTALALGAGRVWAAALDPQAPRVDPLAPELMLRSPDALLGEAAAAQRGCLVFGPGAGHDAAAAQLLASVLRLPQPLLIDADGLNLLAAAGPGSPLWALLRARRAPTWLTPHPGEAAALLATDVATIQHDRIGALQALLARTGAGCVLKGAGSLIGAPDGQVWINTSGNGLLATAGSGDVLSGAIAAMVASGHGLDGVRAAVWLHGAAADAAADAGRVVLRAGELPALLEQAWAAALA